jgi:biotin synthase
MPLQKRFEVTLNMIAVLRLLAPDINIASVTALQAINSSGREMALLWGSNVIMPNITPTENRKNYQLYKNKPGINEGKEETLEGLLTHINAVGKKVAFNEWGDSLHYFNRS